MVGAGAPWRIAGIEPKPGGITSVRGDKGQSVDKRPGERIDGMAPIPDQKVNWPAASLRLFHAHAKDGDHNEQEAR